MHFIKYIILNSLQARVTTKNTDVEVLSYDKLWSAMQLLQISKFIANQLLD